MEAIKYFNEKIEELQEDIEYYKDSIDSEKRTVNVSNGHIKIFHIRSLEKHVKECYEKIGFYRQAINALAGQNQIAEVA